MGSLFLAGKTALHANALAAYIETIDTHPHRMAADAPEPAPHS